MANQPQNGRSQGSTNPLPISALPVPDDDAQAVDPKPSLPTNSKGELTPAQRARLGLDVFGEQASQPEPDPGPAAPTPLPLPADPPQPTSVTSNNTAPTDFGFRQIDPFEHQPAAPQPVEPQVAPVGSEPRLAPAQSEPALRPATNRAQPSDSSVAAEGAQRRRPNSDGTPELDRDRSVLTYGVAWTLFAMLVTAGIAFTSSMSSATGEAAGPGPLVPALISIGIGWVIVFAARGMGKNWVYLMILPAAILFIGPYVYAQIWSTSIEDSARTYLSPTGANALIDVDQTSVVSETVNTERGCFSITKDRQTEDTEVAVVTYVPETARQQADYSLAPRYARRIPAGGERTTQRVFTFKGGVGPAIVSEAQAAPLDCASSTAP